MNLQRRRVARQQNAVPRDPFERRPTFHPVEGLMWQTILPIWCLRKWPPRILGVAISSPEMILSTALILLSLVLLYFGAEWLVQGGAGLALRLGLTPVVVGLTVVAFGTSAPELLVSCRAALAGQGDIAVGNVVGSNLFNIGVILGISALVCPPIVQRQLIRVDAPVMLGASLLFVLLFRDHTLGRGEALGMFLLLVAYTVALIVMARRQTGAGTSGEVLPVTAHDGLGTVLDLGRIGVGLGVLVLGARLLVTHAVEVARGLGVSEAVIGLTIIAAGTSMPELATSVVAALRRQPDIAVGNVIGSNIFNLLGILGVSGMLSPIHAPGILALDLSAMVAFAAALLPILLTGGRVSRFEGGFLVTAYVAYLVLLWPN